jgi:hypothetical protein
LPRRRKRSLLTPRTCFWCGTEFFASQGPQRYCTPDCQRLAKPIRYHPPEALHEPSNTEPEREKLDLSLANANHLADLKRHQATLWPSYVMRPTKSYRP